MCRSKIPITPNTQNRLPFFYYGYEHIFFNLKNKSNLYIHNEGKIRRLLEYIKVYNNNKQILVLSRLKPYDLTLKREIHICDCFFFFFFLYSNMTIFLLNQVFNLHLSISTIKTGWSWRSRLFKKECYPFTILGGGS